MLEDFFNHKCDIFHLVKNQEEGCYGIRGKERMVPEKTPSEENVSCHFHTKSNNLQIVQGEPYRGLAGEVKLSLPIDTDIRKNDVVRSRETGMYYRADLPKNIQGHHLTVVLRREDGVKGAI
ncbi:MAG: DUF3599 family protein [Lachnospiraceae bacterium]|nr:DUF3599 family protein [Lachnospiraceae bacterium]